MSDELRLPCRESGTPDDWFIGKDGKQYPSDEFLTDEIRDIVNIAADRLELSGEARVTFIDKALDRAEVDAKTEALRRRRHAKEACFDCALRTRCLDIALNGDEQHGTWGGYHEEEIRAIKSEITRRKRARRPLE